MTLEFARSTAHVDSREPVRDRLSGFLRSDLGHYLPFVMVAGLVLAVDQWSKYFVTGYVNASGQGQIAILGGKVLIDPIANTGAAFGVLPNQTILLTAIAVIIASALVIAYRRLARGPVSIRVGLGMVLGGALGNLLDRIRFGHVIDFIDLRWWPVFNVADSCIVTGVAMLILTLLIRAEHRATQ